MFRYSAVLLVGLWAVSPAVAGAEAYFSELVKDFGAVPRGPTLSHAFRVTNTTDKIVRINGVRVSCGCVTAFAQQQEIAPGQSSAVQALMDTRRFTGPKTVTIYVTFEQPRWEEVRLQVIANGREDLIVNPDSFTFGTIRKGSTPNRSITVTLLGSSSYQAVEVERESNFIVPSLREIRREGTESTYQIDVAIRNDLPVGKWFTDVYVKTTHPIASRVRLPISVEVEPGLSLSHTSVTMGDVKAGTESERKVILKGSEPFKINKVEGSDDVVSVTSNTTESKPVHILTVKVKSDKLGDLSRKLKILTDLKDDNSVELQASAKVVK